MKEMFDKHKAGVALGLILGLWHLTWSLLVASGQAQVLIDWIFRLHFIQPPYTITQFSVGTAATLIVVTSVLGYVLGWLFAAIWNGLHAAARIPS
jgi:hypothetical protein